MAKKASSPLQDHLGRDLKIDDPVAFFHRGYKCMRTGRIQKMSRINVGISWSGLHGDDYRSVRSTEVILLPDDAYAFHVLRSNR